MRRSRRPLLPLPTLSILGVLAACGGNVDTDQTSIGDGVNGVGNGSGSSNGSSSGSSTGGTAGEANNGEPAGTADWPMLGYDAASTYHNANETRISVETAPDLQVAWTADLGGSINAAPIQVGGVVYVPVIQPPMNYALDAETGEIIWQHSDFAVGATYAYADGVIYALAFDGVLHAMDARTGEAQWELETTSQESMTGFSSPIIGGDLVVIGGSSFEEIVRGVIPAFRGFVFAADRNTGSEAWTRHTVGENETGASVWSSVSFDPDSGRVYAGTGNNYVPPATDTSDAIVAFAMSNGAIEWKNQRLEGDIFSLAAFAMGISGREFDFGANPIVFDAPADGEMRRLVAGGQKSGDVHVLRADDGQLLWTRSLSPGSASGRSGIFNNGAWDGERLLFAANGVTNGASGSEPIGAVLFALEPATGDIVWERQLPEPVMAPITMAGGVGFVAAGPHLQAFDTSTGALLFEHTAEATIASAPTIANVRVAFVSGINWSVGTQGQILTMLDLR